MGHRLSKIVTRTGDNGTTGLADGSRISKNSLRIHCIGEVDELNSHLGLMLSEPVSEDIRTLLTAIQHDLFDLGGSLAYPARPFSDDKLVRLDDAIEHYNAKLAPLKEFILPGGSRTASLCHICRTVARRAERHFVSLAEKDIAPINGLEYLNRLSDLLFVLARYLNEQHGKEEVQWQNSVR